MAKVEINPSYCKSCGLCLTACKKAVLAVGSQTNDMGYYYVVATQNDQCVGCGLCAVFCPEGAIEVYR